MPGPLALKPTHAPVRAYYLALAQLANVGAKHETAVREAWHTLIEHCAPKEWTLVREYTITRKDAAPLRLDAVLIDTYRIPHGVIEDKDDADDLAVEMRAKLKLGYPAKNIIFWQPRRALLVQDGKVVLDYYLDTKPEQLCEILARFFAYTEPVIADWERATEEFRERVAELGASLAEVIQRARGTKGTLPNKKFAAAFSDFAGLCRAAINPGLADSAIEEMLIQHLLTARLFGSVFNNPDFTRRNVVAVEIEKVIDALASSHFSRTDFLKKLDRFYVAIESAATVIEDFSEKQKFLNTVYEKFFQGFAVKVADTMGIVYTPPSIVRFMILEPDERHTWLHDEEGAGFGKFAPIGSKETKATDSLDAHAIFATYSRGITSSRDEWVYDYDPSRLAEKTSRLIENYNSEVGRFRRRTNKKVSVDDFVSEDSTYVKWTDRLKNALVEGKELIFDENLIRRAAYRPFSTTNVYFDDLLIHRRYLQARFFPTKETENENVVISLTDVAGRSPFSALAAKAIVELHFCASTDTFQCFPLYTYAEDGSHRRDNVTDWAVEQFKARYPNAKLTKRDIFHYVYAILHHPDYREKYAANLRRELPRIPFVPDFPAFAKAGEKLAALHTGFESQKEFKLKRVETKGVKPIWRVERMKLSKDKTTLAYNDWLTLEGIPAAAHDYRLGNRSALDWVIDQYRVERDAGGEITSDPNRADDEEYIVRLVGQIVAVSVETVTLIKSLPALE